VSPAQTKPLEPILVGLGTGLVLKFSGNITFSNKRAIRKVQSVLLTISTKPRDTNISNVDEKLQQVITKPHNGSFIATSLINFTGSFTYQVIVKTHLVDDKDVLWSTGPEQTLLVKVGK